MAASLPVTSKDERCRDGSVRDGGARIQGYRSRCRDKTVTKHKEKYSVGMVDRQTLFKVSQQDLSRPLHQTAGDLDHENLFSFSDTSRRGGRDVCVLPEGDMSGKKKKEKVTEGESECCPHWCEDLSFILALLVWMLVVVCVIASVPTLVPSPAVVWGGPVGTCVTASALYLFWFRGRSSPVTLRAGGRKKDTVGAGGRGKDTATHATMAEVLTLCLSVLFSLSVIVPVLLVGDTQSLLELQRQVRDALVSALRTTGSSRSVRMGRLLVAGEGPLGAGLGGISSMSVPSLTVAALFCVVLFGAVIWCICKAKQQQRERQRQRSRGTEAEVSTSPIESSDPTPICCPFLLTESLPVTQRQTQRALRPQRLQPPHATPSDPPPKACRQCDSLFSNNSYPQRRNRSVESPAALGGAPPSCLTDSPAASSFRRCRSEASLRLKSTSLQEKTCLLRPFLQTLRLDMNLQINPPTVTEPSASPSRMALPDPETPRLEKCSISRLPFEPSVPRGTRKGSLKPCMTAGASEMATPPFVPPTPPYGECKVTQDSAQPPRLR
uniref:Uncharacterized protein n=1 Tax=Chromera velia CCMP2878 TaxID=1169474 RepID=A0A0G4I4Y3_9ALVE|eukprot:Cvel_11010.t1-p1 / transcript=Cvel_11010.t1 / gene=Cvel_11010 / organism=Chromera_velia_CCMP2878 / gene_product=hypothetical protein / transcript_product=hypothetical protein / location=Cvel_scaffold678:69573-71441(+) / protein_length=551 / sequence_SO=supercontig / SO=protein_coding / is_pseudo=false